MALIEGNPGTNNLVGTPEDDQIFGFAQNDTLSGLGGNDLLDGGTDFDTMDGGIGNDTIFVDNAGDVVIEAVGGGNDTVAASVNYTLGAGVEVELLTTGFINNIVPIDLTGNEFSQEIWGNNGNNTLDGAAGNDDLVGFAGNDLLIGGTGADNMLGGTGNDTYFVDNAGDVVIEASGEGNDSVAALVDYTLTAGAHVELLTTGNVATTNVINLTGNELNNEIWGNAAANTLNGGAGNDALVGFGGNDMLIGGAGIDVMIGGTGDDTYFVDHASDVVVESAGEGNDSVAALVNYTLTAGASVELLTTGSVTSTNAVNLTGNELNNEIWGNAAANTLNGGAGSDDLVGFGGNDILIGGTGADNLLGGTGDDTYFVDDAGDVVIEASGEGNDSVAALVNYTLSNGSHVELLTTGDVNTTNAINLTGNDLVNTIWGNNAANTLNGGGGSDTLIGFAGADTFAFSTPLGASNIDTIAGFVSGQDKIALDDAIFSNLAVGALSADAFVTGAAAADANDRIVFNSSTGALSFDPDGNGATAAFQFAILPSGTALLASDFVVI